jgi:hypothetical protein
MVLHRPVECTRLTGEVSQPLPEPIGGEKRIYQQLFGIECVQARLLGVVSAVLARPPAQNDA